MKTIQLRFQRSFFLRQGFVGGMQIFFCIVIMMLMRHGGLLVKFAPVIFVGPWLAIVLREYLISARQVDDEGVTRNDGKRFLWSDLRRINEVKMIIAGQHTGPVNHVDIVFKNGSVRILLAVLQNGIEAWQFVMGKKKTLEASAPPPPAAASSTPAAAPPAAATGPKCGTCGELGDCHRGFQKGGDEANSTFLPAASDKLKTIKVINPNVRPTQSLQQCAECGAWFLHETSYEYLVYGSEDEQTLSRITEEKAKALLNG